MALLAEPRRDADAADRRATQVASTHPPPDHVGPAGRGAFLRRGERDWLGTGLWIRINLMRIRIRIRIQHVF